MRRFILVFALIVAACNGAGPATPVPTSAQSPTASAIPTIGTPVPFVPSPSRPASPAASASQSFEAGNWPPDWQRAICAARAQLLRPDAQQAGRPGEDAATQAIADLKSTQLNWDPGADLRALIGKAGFILLDAAQRGGAALNDVPPAIAAMATAYADLGIATGFTCPA